MTRDETRTLLRARSALTSQPYGDDTVETWHQVLKERTLEECRTALLKSATHHQRITFAHIFDELPPRATLPATPLDTCELCDDTGWVNDEHYHAKHCPRTRPCPCHGVKPCRCTRGQAMIETQRRITEANRR